MRSTLKFNYRKLKEKEFYHKRLYDAHMMKEDLDKCRNIAEYYLAKY